MFPVNYQVVSFVLLVAVSLSAAAVDREQCERPEAAHGCTVDNGHAHCEVWDLAASIHGLPACTTRITFSLTSRQDFPTVDFSNLTNLKELWLYTKRENYDITLDHFEMSRFKTVKAVRILSIRAEQNYHQGATEENKDTYKHMEFLEVLDLTRAKRIGLAVANHLIGSQPKIKTLILRNVQEMHYPFSYAMCVDLTRFICGGKVHHLDLSYNDISSVNVSSMCLNSKLRYLDLRSNILASIVPRNGLFKFLLSLSGLETMLLSTEDEYQKDLWNDDYINDLIVTHDDIKSNKYSLITELSQEPPLDSLAGYRFYLQDIVKHCGISSYFHLVQCIVESQDLCSFFGCVSPKLNASECVKNRHDHIEFFTRNMCDYDHCLQNMQFPLPLNFRQLMVHNLGKYSNLRNDDLSLHNQTLCIHPHNNLEVIDMPNVKFSSTQTTGVSFGLSGLRKLRFLNFQGDQFPIFVSDVTFSDMDALTEVHIGGSKLAENDILPTRTLHLLISLSILNLSNANLLGIESDAFLNHKRLFVLDLSHNQLSASLSSLDLSQTSMKYLNLSFNQLTSIPISVRNQLDKMEDLELYLSGNMFICNCDNLAFLQWIQSSSSITFHYAGDHVCTDSPGNTIHNIAIDSLYCDWYWKQPVIAAGSSLALTLFCLGVFTAYKKRWFISNLIFRLQEWISTASDETIPGSYKFDAYVLYSSNDVDRIWVHLQLVKVLEKFYGFRVCIHLRNFTPGVDIAENIKQAILQSRKVLVVMSPNFVASDWCIEEVQITRSTDRNKFIVIMYKDVLSPDVPKPAVIQHLLETRTYIEWHEAPEAQTLFWKRLRKALWSKHMVAKHQTDDHMDRDDEIILLH